MLSMQKKLNISRVAADWSKVEDFYKGVVFQGSAEACLAYAEGRQVKPAGRTETFDTKAFLAECGARV
jgi:hypothetical protein